MSQVSSFLSLQNLMNKSSFDTKISEKANSSSFYNYHNNNSNKPPLAIAEDAEDNLQNIEYDLQTQSFSNVSTIKSNLQINEDIINDEIYTVLNDLLSIIESTKN